jgi:hypothetical protein
MMPTFYDFHTNTFNIQYSSSNGETNFSILAAFKGTCYTADNSSAAHLDQHMLHIFGYLCGFF